MKQNSQKSTNVVASKDGKNEPNNGPDGKDLLDMSGSQEEEKKDQTEYIDTSSSPSKKQGVWDNENTQDLFSDQPQNQKKNAQQNGNENNKTRYPLMNPPLMINLQPLAQYQVQQHQQKRQMRIYCLYKPVLTGSEKSMSLMLHRLDQYGRWCDKTFFPMATQAVKFGSQSFNIYYIDHINDDSFLPLFQTRYLSSGKMYNLDYYEKEHHHRNFLQDRNVQFVFDMQIMRNLSHSAVFSNQDPSGTSILDSMQQLIYYVYSLFAINAHEHLDELFVQFKAVNPAISILNKDFLPIISDFVNTILQSKTEDPGNLFSKALPIFGMLQSNVKSIRELKIPQAGQFINKSINTVTSILVDSIERLKQQDQQKDSIFKQLWSMPSATLKGFVFNMVLNYLESISPLYPKVAGQSPPWQAVLEELSKVDALGCLILIRALIQRLLDNNIRLRNEQLFWLNTLIKKQLQAIKPSKPEKAEEEKEDKGEEEKEGEVEKEAEVEDEQASNDMIINTGDIQDIMLKLLEQPTDLPTFIKVLKMIYENDAAAQNDEEQKGEEEGPRVEIEFDNESQAKIYKIVNDFLSKFMEENLDNISSFLQTVKDFKGAPYEIFFIKSQAKKLIERRLTDLYLFRYEYQTRVKQLRAIFITNYNDIYIDRALFAPIILEKKDKNLQEDSLILLNNLDNFPDCYKKLLKDWGDWDLNLELAQKYFKSKTQYKMSITILVSEFDGYILDLAKECPDLEDVKYKYQKDFITKISREAASSIYTRSTQIKDKILIDFEPLQKLTTCKVKQFRDAYIELAQDFCVRNPMQMKNPPFLPLEKLIVTHNAFRQRDQNMDQIMKLVDYAFTLYKERPDLNKVKGELLGNPTINHVWYLFLSNYAAYNTQDPVRHIAKVVKDIAMSLKNEHLIIFDLIQIRDLSYEQKRSFKAYMELALKIMNTGVDPGQQEKIDFEESIQSQLRAVDQFLTKKNQVQQFLFDTMKLKSDSPLAEAFQTHFKDFMDKTLQQVREFPDVLTKIQEMADRMFTLRDSKVFLNFLEQEHKANPYIDDQGIVNADQMMSNIKEAFMKLKAALVEFLTCQDDSQYPVKKLAIMLGEKVRINNMQAKSEQKALREMFDRENRNDLVRVHDIYARFDLLEKMLLSFSELNRLESVCQGVINIATMQYTHKKNGEEVTGPVFNLNMNDALTNSQNFIQVCIKQKDTSSLKDFDKAFTFTSFKLYKVIEDVVSKMEEKRINRADRAKKEEAKAGDLFENANIASVVKILRSFNQGSIELFQFLKIISGQELDQLKEYVNDYDDEGVSTQTILNCVSLWDYMSDINDLSKQQGGGGATFSQLINFIAENLDTPKYKELDDKIDKCNHQIVAIKELKGTLESKEEAKKKQILQIMKMSQVSFIGPDEQIRAQDTQLLQTPSHDIAKKIIAVKWNVELKYTKMRDGRTLDDKKFSIEDINELRDRALLIQNTLTHEHNKKKQQTEEERQKIEEEQKEMSDFILFAKTIQSILNNLDSLFVAGYPKDHQLFQNEVFLCYQSEFNELRNFENETFKQLQNWIISMTEAYNNCYFMTFLTGENIWVLSDYLDGKLTDKQQIDKAENLLRLMGKQLDGNGLGNQMIQGAQEDPKERLMRLADRLNDLEDSQDNDDSLRNLNRTLDATLDGDKQKVRINIKEGDILYLETDKYFEGFISIYANSGRHFPRHDQLFFCHEKTQWQEVQSFMYHCLKSPKKELHTLIYPEQLTLENQEKLIALIQKFMKEEMNHDPFYFCLIAKEGRSLISDYLRQQNYRKVIKDQQLLYKDKITDIVNQFDTSSVFVTSAYAGLGKSHYIKVQARKEKKTIVMFPIAGALDFDEIAERLSNIRMPENGIVLALQIRFVDNLDLLNELLVHLALFRVMISGSNVFILPPECQLYIELGNTFDQLFENKLIYLKYTEARKHHIQTFDLSKFEVNQKFLDQNAIQNDKIQFICNQLLHFQNSNIKNELASQEINFKILSQQQVIQILGEYFVKSQIQAKQQPNFIQLQVFLKIIGQLLRNLEKGIYTPSVIALNVQDFIENALKDFAQEYQKIRITIIKAILDSVQEFTVKSINRKIRDTQGQARVQIAAGNNDADADLENEFHMTLSWESSNHFTEIFIEDGYAIFVYKDPNQIPQDIQKLIFINQCIQQGKEGPQIAQLIAQKQMNLPDLTKMSDGELQQKLQLFRTTIEEFKTVNNEYVVTTDNFLKMCIIYLRVQSRVPVVIMGETGCGKTSLIKFFCQNVLNDKLIIFNIHAGITAGMILDKVQECIYEAHSIDQNKKLWVFFDEFNTSENLGLICEILSERTILGQPIPDNICLLAACNPFKLRSKKVEFGENVGIKRAKAKNRVAQNLLMYTVHPIPDNIIEYVWDFGALTDLDCMKYINQMLIKAEVQNVAMVAQMLMGCHKYFKEREDSSSVSLRDVARFIILYQWFKQSINDKKRLERQFRIQDSARYLQNKHKYNLKTVDYYNIQDIDLRASILALTHCYYLRISSIASRKYFLEFVCAAQTQDRFLNVEKILDIINFEQNDYIIRMDLQEGTAVNQALKENIFAIIPCIINRIPIFICGKPGCSKSLAISLVFQNLRGEKSIDLYFKTLKELTMVSFQGSESCTSDGIIKAYEKAKKYLELKELDITKDLLPVFVFDEIGLAELSKYNPLKVLHSLLEVENREIAFVGISNWRLDASKMNRALYLARPDPDENDLKFTAFCIYQQICLTEQHKHLIECLASSYFELKDYFKRQKPEFQDFYGLRDFYHLIKQISRTISKGQHNNREEPEKDLLYWVNVSIQRNFGGRLGAAEKMGQYFAEKFNVQDTFPTAVKLTPNVRELIHMNLADRDSRYLMLIGRPDVLRFILETYFKEHIQESRTIVGSKLENDQRKEEYGFRALSDIILYVEKGISVILYGMEDIYSSLYDLFNQNFAVYGEKRYCRIALGAQLNPQCFVHDDFHSVIFMNEDDESLQAADAPFLNRFEKHHIKLEDALDPHQKYVVNELKGWIDSLLKNRLREKQILLHETNIFPNFSLDMLGILVMQEEWPILNANLLDNGEQAKSEEDVIKLVIENCKKKLISIATQDIIILAQIADIDVAEMNWITETYREIHSISFKNKLGQYIEDGNIEEENFSQKVLIFTYSLGFDMSLTDKHGDRSNFRSISNFKSEQEIIKQLHQFYDSEKEAVFILDAHYINDKQHISFIKFIIDKVERDAIEGKKWKGCKTIIFMVHMQRNFNELNQSQIPVFDQSWDQYVFYDISPQPFDLSENIIIKNTRQLLKEETIVKFHQSLGTMTEKCLLKLTFDGDVTQETQDLINENMFFIIENIGIDETLIDVFKKKIFDSIQKEMRVIDWKDEISCNKDILKDSINVEQAIKMVIEGRYEQYLTILLFQIERYTAFRSYFTKVYDAEGQEIPESINLIKQIWISSFNRLRTTQIQLQNLSQSNYTSFIANLKFPFSRLEAAALIEINKEQNTFEALEDNAQSPIEFFSENFNQKTKLGDMIQDVINDRYVQEIYVEDIVKIFLIDNLLKPEYLNIVMIIMKKIMNDPTTSFYQKIYTFLSQQRLFFSLCTILELFLQLKGDQLSLKQLEDSFQEQLDEMGQQSWEEMIRYVIDEVIIKNSQPDMNGLQKLETINNMSSVYEKFYSNLFNFKATVKIRYLSIIRFWTDFTSLVAEKGGVLQNFLFKCSVQAQKIDGADEDDPQDVPKKRQSFLEDIGFINMVVVFFETGCKTLVLPAVNNDDQDDDTNDQDSDSDDDNDIVEHETVDLDDRTIKFLASFFTIILELNFKRLAIVAKRFEMPQYKSLFKYSSSIFQEIIKATKITTIVEEFRYQVQNDKIQVDVANDVIPEIELPEHNEIQVFEKVLSDITLNSSFAVAINDLITKACLNTDLDRVYALNYLTNEFHLHLRQLVKLGDQDNLKKGQITYPCLKSLIAHAILKSTVEIYTELIFQNHLERERQNHPDWDREPFDEGDDIKERREEIEQEMCRREWGPIRTLQVYCLKQLRQKMNLGFMQFKDLLKNNLSQHVKWLEESEAIQEDREEGVILDVFPQFNEVSQAQEVLEKDLKIFMKYRLPEQKNQIKNHFRDMKTIQDNIKVALAFFNVCFLQYADPKQDPKFPELHTFYQEELEEIAELKCSVQYAQLLKYFITNFPVGNFLRLQNNLGQMEIHYKVLSCHILIQILSNVKEKNPLSTLFFDYDQNGKIALKLNQFNNNYMPGIELEEKYQYLFHLYTNFEELKNKDKVYNSEDFGGANYSCGVDCDYFYILENCGNANQAGTCPWCQRSIGAYKGQYNVIEVRPGHTRFKNQQAKEYLANMVQKYEQNQKGGYSVVNAANQEVQLSFYQTRPLSWRLIRQFIHVPLYYFMTVGGSNLEQVKQVINFHQVDNLGKTMQDFLQSHILNDFKILEKLLSIAGNDSIHPWLYSIINNYTIELNAGRGLSLQTNEGARQFEAAFDTKVIGNRSDRIGDVAQEYKKSLQAKEGKQMNEFDQVFQEINPVLGIYPGIQFYRLIRVPSFDDMCTSFQNSKANEIAFPILKVCINNYDTMIKLRKLYPIIDFTNIMLQRFNHMLKREDARQKKIKDVWMQEKEDSELIKASFQNFLKAWNTMGLNTIQFQCHQLEKIKYDENSEVIHFLPDNKEKGNGMAMLAAMQELGKIQNQILGDVLKEYSRLKQLDTKFVIDTEHHYPIQRMKPNHIVEFPIDKPIIIKSCAMNSLTYGRGQELVYDFARMETNIMKDFEQRKLIAIDEQSFEVIQYQMEIFISSGNKKNFITEIRERVKQEPFDKNLSIRIDQYFEGIEGKGKEEQIQTLRELHGGLEKILCFLQNTKEKPDSTIEEFVNNKMKGNKHKTYSENTTLSQLKLKNIIALYEKLEEKYFPFVTSSIRPDYLSVKKEQDIKDRMKTILKKCELVQDGGDAQNEGELIPSRKQFQNALLRFIIRCLAGDLNKEEPIANYLPIKYDIWDEDVLEQDHKLINLGGLLANDNIKLEDAYCTYQVVYDLNFEKEKKALGPQIGKQEAPRQDLKDPNMKAPVGPPPAPKPKAAAAAQKAKPPNRPAAPKKKDEEVM